MAVHLSEGVIVKLLSAEVEFVLDSPPVAEKKADIFEFSIKGVLIFELDISLHTTGHSLIITSRKIEPEKLVQIARYYNKKYAPEDIYIS